MSYVSFDKSSDTIDTDVFGAVTITGPNNSLAVPTVTATPKLMRKRRAEDESLPFSTSKK